MNGRDQVNAMRKLMNSDQRAPAAEQWKPDQLGGIRIGDQVRLPAVDCVLEVIGLADPLLILRSPAGHELKAGWRACQRIRTRSEIQTGR